MNAAADFALPRPQLVSGYGLRRALAAGIRRVLEQRDAINRINVFPVPDGDTGTNLAFTLSSMLAAIQTPRLAHAGDVLKRAASEAIDGARGNSGAIIAQFFQGLAESSADARRVSPQALAAGAQRGADLAREALAEPREGTILSVITVFARALRQASAEGRRDFRGAFDKALAAAREALADTPNQLAVLKSAGVVDAGARGFVDLLEGVDDFIRGRLGGRHVAVDAELAAAGVDSVTAEAEEHGPRYCTECMVSGPAVDRLALKAALLAQPIASLVIAGTREKVRIHVHVDEPQRVFDICATFGTVSSQKADDMHRQTQAAHQQMSRVAIVTDSAADLPLEAMERLAIHLVPVRISLGSRDFLDRVSLSPSEFYRELRDSPVMPRTSQPPPGDFRRLFEFLLSHHQQLVYVGLSRALSGTLQSAETAAGRFGAERAVVLDSRAGSAAQALLTIAAAEAAAEGADVAAIRRRVAELIPRTRYYAAIRDLRYGVRGGRAPPLAATLSTLLRAKPIVAGKDNGKLGMAGVIFGRDRFAERMSDWLLRRLDPRRRWRILVGHCDCPDDGATVHRRLLERLPEVDGDWLVEAGSGIGAHAGPGSLVIGVQDRGARG